MLVGPVEVGLIWDARRMAWGGAGENVGVGQNRHETGDGMGWARRGVARILNFSPFTVTFTKSGRSPAKWLATI